MNGICTLANDRVYDQLIALLNSIEQRYGTEMPVCIYPYDEQTERIAAAIQSRPQVQIYADQDSMVAWDQFVRQVWDAHPTARQCWGSDDPAHYHRVGTHRRFCAFDGPFDRFVYMDADTLLLQPLEEVFAALDQQDWVVYDFQHKDLTHVYDVNSAKLPQVFSPKRLQTEIFCSGFYASKRGLFDASARANLLSALQSEAEILYPMAPDQTILNYMVMKSGLAATNLALGWPSSQSTGNSITSTHFEERDHQLYDQGKPLIYLHYIGLSSRFFDRLCGGENIHFPYRDLFLHYRYLDQPRPVWQGQPVAYDATLPFQQRIQRKLNALAKPLRQAFANRS
jgi:hypothetical protein